jgi:hypothetical protein
MDLTTKLLSPFSKFLFKPSFLKIRFILALLQILSKTAKDQAQREVVMYHREQEPTMEVL